MSEVKKVDTDQQQFWQMVIETWQPCGLSIRQFCKQEGLLRRNVTENWYNNMRI